MIQVNDTTSVSTSNLNIGGKLGVTKVVPLENNRTRLMYVLFMHYYNTLWLNGRL